MWKPAVLDGCHIPRSQQGPQWGAVPQQWHPHTPLTTTGLQAPSALQPRYQHNMMDTRAISLQGLQPPLS